MVDACETSVDLTQWVKGTYGYLLKLQTVGNVGQLALRSVKIETWVQVAPISLPRLASGKNHCRYELGDRYGKLTRPMFVSPNAAIPEDLEKYVVAMPKDYDRQRKTARIRGDVVLRLEAPAGATIDWLTAGACFTTFQNQAARDTDNRIAYAVGTPNDFREVYRANVPTWVNHWRYQWDEDIRPASPVTVVYLKYTGKPAVNVLRATVHLRPDKKPSTALQITHAYQVGDRLVEKVVNLNRPTDYSINVDGQPKNIFLRMAVPSQASLR